MLKPILVRQLTYTKIRHGFFTRIGGVSEGIHQGLNCGLGSADLRTHVLTNRERVANYFDVDAKHLLTLHQTHSALAHSICAPFSDTPPEGDAMATSTPGIVLGILTADCTPVLFADAQAGVIGAAHAGWKGAYGGILEATIVAMERLGAQRERITTAIGPCIAQTSYEVGEEFYERIVSASGANAAFFSPGQPGKWQFDLPGYVAAQLSKSGITVIQDLARDTCSDALHFFSYRRATLRGEPSYGRQLSCIMLEK